MVLSNIKIWSEIVSHPFLAEYCHRITGLEFQNTCSFLTEGEGHLSQARHDTVHYLVFSFPKTS